MYYIPVFSVLATVITVCMHVYAHINNHVIANGYSIIIISDNTTDAHCICIYVTIRTFFKGIAKEYNYTYSMQLT